MTVFSANVVPFEVTSQEHGCTNAISHIYLMPVHQCCSRTSSQYSKLCEDLVHSMLYTLQGCKTRPDQNPTLNQEIESLSHTETWLEALMCL